MCLIRVPSLYLRGGALGQSQGTVGTSGMSLRGIDQARTLILLDGQPIQDAGSGKVNWRVPFVEDIARVEVVPGAFSSLYGSNAIGGVVISHQATGQTRINRKSEERLERCKWRRCQHLFSRQDGITGWDSLAGLGTRIATVT